VTLLRDDDLEGAVLGAALTDRGAAELVVKRCEPSDFYLDTHRRVLAEVTRLVAAGQRPDAVLVAQVIDRDHRPDVQSLPGRCPLVVNTALYVARLQAVAARRRLALVLERAVEQVEGGLAAGLRAELLEAASDERVEGAGG
jgi:replicative DNA helicase